MNTVKQFYKKYGSHMMLTVGTLISGATLLYIVDDCHKCEMNNLKKVHNDEIKALTKNFAKEYEKLNNVVFSMKEK